MTSLPTTRNPGCTPIVTHPRRQAAILVADMVGYSRLMEANEESHPRLDDAAACGDPGPRHRGVRRPDRQEHRRRLPRDVRLARATRSQCARALQRSVTAADRHQPTEQRILLPHGASTPPTSSSRQTTSTATASTSRRAYRRTPSRAASSISSAAAEQARRRPRPSASSTSATCRSATWPGPFASSRSARRSRRPGSSATFWSARSPALARRAAVPDASRPPRRRATSPMASWTTSSTASPR